MTFMGALNYVIMACLVICAEPHSSVDSAHDLRTGGRLFDPRVSQYSVRGLTIVTAKGFIPLSAVRCFDNGNVGKQPVA